MRMPVIWIDTTTYPEARASLEEWAEVTGPQDAPDRPWQESLAEVEGAVITARYAFDAHTFARARVRSWHGWASATTTSISQPPRRQACV